MMKAFGTIIFLTFAPHLAWGLNGSAYVNCENGEHVLTISGWHNPETDGEFVGLVFERQAVGICDEAVIVPEVPLPFEPVLGGGYHQLEFEATVTLVPPISGVSYRYQPYGVKPDGSLVRIFTFCDNDFRGYALASCDGQPFDRGTVEISYNCGGGFCFSIKSCQDDCWTEGMGQLLDQESFEYLYGVSPFEVLGQVVDVYGERTYCGMPGDPRYSVTKIALAPIENCGPVPISTMNWGSLKATYR